MRPRRRMPTALLALALAAVAAAALAPGAEAAPAPAPAPSPAAAPAPAAPDPRRGERLDGRAPPRRSVRHALLWPARAAVHVVVLPAVVVARVLEEGGVVERVRPPPSGVERHVSLRPIVDYQTGFDPSVGLAYEHRRAFGPGGLLRLRARTWGPDVLFGELTLAAPAGPAAPLGLTTTFDRRDDALLEHVRYGYDRGVSRAEAILPVVGDLALAVGAALDLRTYDDLDAPDLRLVRGELAARWDSRGPRHRGGGLVEAGAVVSEGIAGDPSRHVHLLAGARAHLPLGDRTLVLGLRGRLVAPLLAVPIPFEELPSVGGLDAVRAIPPGRLDVRRDLVGTLEWRWLIHQYLDAAVFVDVGWVPGRVVHGYGLALLRYDPQPGLRPDRLLDGLTITWAPDEGVRLLLDIQP